MITVTAKAAANIKRVAQDEGFTRAVLRMKVLGGGCAGFTYDLAFIDDVGPTDTDEIFTQDDITLVVDPMSLQYLDGTEVDYVDGKDFAATGFKFNNPNALSSCGCGSSFQA